MEDRTAPDIGGVTPRTNVVVSPTTYLISDLDGDGDGDGDGNFDGGVAVVTFDDEYGTRKGRKLLQLRSYCDATSIAFCLSFVTMMIGLSLFVFSANRNREAVEVPNGPGGLPEPLFDRNATNTYWLRLKSDVLAPQEVVVPGTPVWKALQWMSTKDPLRPLPLGWQATQRYALVVAFYRWSGESGWELAQEDGWIQSKAGLVEHECDWTGVGCNSDKEVTSLTLGTLDDEQSTFVLYGQIPSELGLLPSLETLDVSGHSLKGVLPTELATLAPTLKSLYASGNRLTTVNAELIGKLTSLETLYLDRNLLQGTLPTTLVNLSRLRVLDVSLNGDLTGNALVMMNSWPNLEEFEISTTRIGGTIPDEIGELSHLNFLGMYYTATTGTIPTSIGKCTALKMISIGYPSGDGNGLNGTIPTEISLLTSLESLGLQMNKFDSTTIPTEFGLLSSLQVLDLQENRNLHGPIPTELGRLSSTFKELLLGGTAITGTLPTELVLLTNLRKIDTYGELNLLAGSPPPGLCQLPLFETIDMTCNDKKEEQFDNCTCCYCF